jgi:DNA-binding LacI/PurR family transcriptional regulator
MPKRATIKDVALRAGVSTATVSFVLNNRPGQAITHEVRQRVCIAAEQLEYHPSAAASGLARQRTNNVAVLFYQATQLVSNPFYSFAIQGAIREATEREYNLMFSYVDRDYRGYADLPKVIRERNSEGVLMIQRVSPEMVRDIQRRGVPVVAIDSFPVVEGVGLLQMDNVRGGHLAAEHLLDLGHERLGVVVAGEDRPSIARRVEGFFAACEQRGLHLSRAKVVATTPKLSFSCGEEAASRLLARKHRPTALFCANDEMAAGALRAARSLGLRVPQDLSVVGFDDIVMSAYTDPPLTTVGGDKERLGGRAMARLLDVIETPAGSPPESRPFREEVRVDLILRDSTGPVSRG